jgi:hypothetical protein
MGANLILSKPSITKLQRELFDTAGSLENHFRVASQRGVYGLIHLDRMRC